MEPNRDEDDEQDACPVECPQTTGLTKQRFCCCPRRAVCPSPVLRRLPRRCNQCPPHQCLREPAPGRRAGEPVPSALSPGAAGFTGLREHSHRPAFTPGGHLSSPLLMAFILCTESKLLPRTTLSKASHSKAGREQTHTHTFPDSAEGGLAVPTLRAQVPLLPGLPNLGEGGQEQDCRPVHRPALPRAAGPAGQAEGCGEGPSASMENNSLSRG